MTTEQLRYFVAVAEREHVTRAAQAVNVSQPALSRALRRLEAELGGALFRREGGTLRLTEPGRGFLIHARRALAELDAGRHALDDALSPDRGTVRLAFLHTLGTWLVPVLIGAYRDQRPAVGYRLEQNGAGPMLRALQEGAVDLALTSPGPEDPGVAFVPLVTEPLWLALPAGHPFAARKRVRLAEVSTERFVCVPPGYGLRATTDELCARAGFVPRVAFEGEDVETLRGLVAAGLGVSLLPLSRTPGGHVVPETPHIRVADRGCARTIGLAWQAGRELLPVAAAFRTFVREAGPRLARAGPG